GDVARELDDLRLHAETDAEKRDLALAGVANGVEHTVDAALTEASGDQDAVITFKLTLPVGTLYALGLDPVNVHFEVVRSGAVQQRFLQALVGIFVLDVFADDGDGDAVARILHPL